MDQFSVQGRIAVVTGASSGLGARFAQTLAGAGATVVAAARRLDRLEALAADQPAIVPVATDLLDEADRAALIDTAVDRFGRVDVLVNNAGVALAGKAIDEPLDQFRRVLELNLTAMFHLSQLSARSMIEGDGGSIINVASMFGLVSSWPAPNSSYTASKGAVVNLTRELGCQWARHGVRVNAIAPGFFPSEATTDATDDDRFRDYVTSQCPMGRLGEPHELDGALLFLASSASTYCTGQILAIDGGWTAH